MLLQFFLFIFLFKLHTITSKQRLHINKTQDRILIISFKTLKN
uniref:Uncharacterized protein n=1 Tax=Meloidogyne enterolobii TaxID=390850 RepID=A0A6V7VK72_MELEN|nr:unnamed protein product [Meloidogyne enterolobii]